MNKVTWTKVENWNPVFEYEKKVERESLVYLFTKSLLVCTVNRETVAYMVRILTVDPDTELVIDTDDRWHSSWTEKEILGATITHVADLEL